MTEQEEKQTMQTDVSHGDGNESAKQQVLTQIKRWTVISGLVIGCSVIIWFGAYMYLRNRECTPTQLLQLNWGVFDSTTIGELTKNAAAFATINTQNPIIYISEEAGLRRNYQEPTSEVLCTPPPPPIACEFATGKCAQDVQGLHPVGARFYLVAYAGEKTKDVLPDPTQPVLEHFTSSVNVQKSNDLKYTVISSSSLTKQEFKALKPAGYFESATVGLDKKTFTASAKDVSPIRISFKRYPPTVDPALAGSEADVLLIDDSLTQSEQAYWVSNLLALKYRLYVYPVGEIYMYPVTK